MELSPESSGYIVRDSSSMDCWDWEVGRCDCWDGVEDRSDRSSAELRGLHSAWRRPWGSWGARSLFREGNWFFRMQVDSRVVARQEVGSDIGNGKERVEVYLSGIGTACDRISQCM